MANHINLFLSLKSSALPHHVLTAGYGAPTLAKHNKFACTQEEFADALFKSLQKKNEILDGGKNTLSL